MEDGNNFDGLTSDLITKSEYDGLNECLNDDKTENEKGFKLLLKKYQGLVVDYYNQDLITKKSVAMMIEKNNMLIQEKSRIESENQLLRRQMKEIIRRMNSAEYPGGETTCIGNCNRKYYDYDERYDKSITHR